MNMWKPTPEGGDSRLKYSAKVTLMLGVALGPGWCPSCGPGRTEASAGPAWGRGQWERGGQSASRLKVTPALWQPAPVSSVQCAAWGLE